jgi:hypothetical protein
LLIASHHGTLVSINNFGFALLCAVPIVLLLLLAPWRDIERVPTPTSTTVSDVAESPVQPSARAARHAVIDRARAERVVLQTVRCVR